MKTFFKKNAYKLSALLLLLTAAQTSLLAEDGKTANATSSLSAGQVIGFMVLLVAIVVLPAFKSRNRIAAK